jgi:hypothetical protein
MSEFIKQDLIRLRDELHPRAFTKTGAVKDCTAAAIVFKIDMCLGNIVWIDHPVVDSGELFLRFAESLVRECESVLRKGS